jgi:hypothetical protein
VNAEARPRRRNTEYLLQLKKWKAMICVDSSREFCLSLMPFNMLNAMIHEDSSLEISVWVSSISPASSQPEEQGAVNPQTPSQGT